MRVLRLGLILAGAAGCGGGRDTESPARSWHVVQISDQLGPDGPLARCVGGTDSAPAWNAASEPHAAVDPADSGIVVVAWQTHAGPRGAVLAARSTDAGRSFGRPGVLPLNACGGFPHPGLTGASDPWTSIGPDGRVYVSALVSHVGGDSGGVTVVAQARGGVLGGVAVAPILDATRYSWIDGSFVTADPAVPGRAMVLTTRLIVPNALRGRADRGESLDWKSFASPGVLATTRDSGRSWTGAVPVTPVAPRLYAAAPQLVVHPGGTYFVFFSGGPHGRAVSMVRSPDGGASWSPPRDIAPYNPLDTGVTHPANPTVTVQLGVDFVRPVVDPATGALHVGFVDAGGSGGRTRLLLVSSWDEGETWSAPWDAGSADTWQVGLPAVAVVGRNALAVSSLALDRPDSTHGKAWPARIEIASLIVAPGTPPSVRERVVVDRFDWLPLRPGGGYFLGDYFAAVPLGAGGVATFYVKTLCGSAPDRCRAEPASSAAPVRAEVFAAAPR